MVIHADTVISHPMSPIQITTILFTLVSIIFLVSQTAEQYHRQTVEQQHQSQSYQLQLPQLSPSHLDTQLSFTRPKYTSKPVFSQQQPYFATLTVQTPHLTIPNQQQIQARRDRLTRRQRERQRTMSSPSSPTGGETATGGGAGGSGLSPTTTNTLNQTMQAMMAWLQANQSSTNTNPPKAPVRSLFSSGKAFDLQNRCDLSAYEKACQPLKQKWDGSAVDWPTFLLGLRDKARDCRWDKKDATGITIIKQGGKDIDILTDHHAILKASIETAFTSRTDERAIQNAEAMYHCIKGSLSGSALTTIFDTPGNAPKNDCGIETLYLLTKLSTLSSTRLSNRAINDINTYDPSVRKFNVPDILKDLAHLFILAGSGKRALDAASKISYLIAILVKIKQPPSFCRYVERKEDEFEAGTLTDYNDFSNDVVIQYNKIKSDDPDHQFKGSLSTVHEDVVAMYTKMRNAQNTTQSSNRASNSNNNRSRTNDTSTKPPPFLTYRKTSNRSDAQDHNVGDTRTWNNDTWYFCDAPHRDDVHWHKHKTEHCNIRKKWEAGKSSSPPATATPAEVVPGDTIVVNSESTSTASSTLTGSSSDPKAMICQILSTLGEKGDGISQALLKDPDKENISPNLKLKDSKQFWTGTSSHFI